MWGGGFYIFLITWYPPPSPREMQGRGCFFIYFQVSVPLPLTFRVGRVFFKNTFNYLSLTFNVRDVINKKIIHYFKKKN